MGNFNMDDYKTVPERIVDFREKHPEGCLRPADLEHPYRIEIIDGRTFIVFVAAAYRTPDDPTPGIGTAYEPFPGPTQFTKDSELQNAETSAWGRAIIAALASESKQIASADEVRNRQAADDLAELERVQADAAAQRFGWHSASERNAEWNRLADEARALPEDEQALIRQEIKKAGFAVADFTPDNATWWAQLIALASPAEPVPVQEKLEAK